MTVLDAQALIAFLTDEPARGEVEALLREADQGATMGAANLAECIDVLVRVKGVPPEAASGAIDLVLESVAVTSIDVVIARRAGDIRGRHYNRVRRPVSLADCLALATALERAEPLATSDPDLVAVATMEGCAVIPLPDQLGHRPTVEA